MGNKLVDTLAGEASNVRRLPQHSEWSHENHRAVLRSVMTLLGIFLLFVGNIRGPE